MSYKRVLEILEAYEPKKLGAGAYYSDDPLCCAVGALTPKVRQIPVEYQATFVDLSAVWDIIGEDLVALGLTAREASRLQDANDTSLYDGPPETPEARYVRVVAWLREQVALEGA